MLEDKIYSLMNYVLAKFIKPDIEVQNVRELDEQLLQILKEKYGIEGIILDVDETLRNDMKSIPQCNQEWIDRVKGMFKVIVVSNGIDGEVESLLKEKGIDYIGFAHKPLKRNFLKACERLNVEPDRVLVVGDDLISDIYGGNRNGMRTAWVREVEL